MNRRTMLLGTIGAAVGAVLPQPVDRVIVRGDEPRFKGKIDVVMWNGREWAVCGTVDFDSLVPGDVIDITSDGTPLQSWSTKIR